MTVWVAACIAAFLFSQQQHIPNRITGMVLPAFLIELAFYLAPGFPGPRRFLESVQPAALRASLILASGLLPYLAMSVRLRTFACQDFALLAALTTAASFWYVAAKPGTIADVLFLSVSAAVFLSRVFRHIYPDPAAHMQLATLGKLAWIHVCIFAVLTVRGWNGPFGFIPNRAEWRAGVESFLLFLPIGGLLAFLLHAVRFKMVSPVWKVPVVAAGVFFGFLWVVALAEEFVFRGFLQELLARAWKSNLAALIAASLLFGAVHLPFRFFPNWPWVAVATVLGFCCGIAYWRTGSMRASMVTHALVVATYRTFFNG
ncbi:MAG TPA: type II CAAX endopeptidase family protein [Bryobacteraceae bacterium]|nr:type II CAAX endopeptidase family protein [Bryobacteraceae bacterium]